MAQTCSICIHKSRASIDEALLVGEPLRKIAERTATSAAALHRHKNGHIMQAALKAKEASDLNYGETVFERLKRVNIETAEILREARAADTPVIALMAIGRLEKQLELEAKLLGLLDTSTKVAIGIQVNSPDGAQMQQMKSLLQVMTPDELKQFESLLNTAQVRLAERTATPALSTGGR